jgi:hypothetical protein
VLTMPMAGAIAALLYFLVRLTGRL